MLKITSAEIGNFIDIFHTHKNILLKKGTVLETKIKLKGIFNTTQIHTQIFQRNNR